jgi:hypothetical protein
VDAPTSHTVLPRQSVIGALSGANQPRGRAVRPLPVRERSAGDAASGADDGTDAGTETGTVVPGAGIGWAAGFMVAW